MSADSTKLVARSEQPSAVDNSWGTRVFAWLARLSYRSPLGVIAVCVALAVLCGLYTYECLYFDSNRSNLIKRTPELQARQDRFIAEFPNAEDMVVLVEGGTEAERRAYMDALGDALRAEPDIFDCVFEKVDGSVLRNRALHFADVPDIKQIAEDMERHADWMRRLVRTKSVLDLPALLQNQQVGDITEQDVRSSLPMLNGFLEQFRLCMETRGRFKYQSPWVTSFLGADSTAYGEFLHSEDIKLYSTLANDSIYLLLVRPRYEAGVDRAVSISKAVVRLKEIVKSLARTHITVLPRLTGELILDYDEGQSSSEDSFISSVWSIILVTAIFVWAFRELYRPLTAVFALGIGVFWTMGFTTLVVGHLNLLTVTCTTILVGLGIDYGIHFIYRYEEERALGLEPLPAMTETLTHAGKENFTGAFSTALAFWVLNLTDFTGIAELGTIAGAGILLCYTSTVLALPAFLYWQERWSKHIHGEGISNFAWLANLERRWLSFPKLVLCLFVVFSVWCGIEAWQVRYDYNLLNLQSQSLDSVQSELHLMERSDHSLLYGITLVKDRAEAQKYIEAYGKLPSVANTECVALMIPDEYERKLPYLRRIEAVAKTIPVPDEWRPSNESMIKRLLAMGKSLQSNDDAIEEFLQSLLASPDKQVVAEAHKLRHNLQLLEDVMLDMGAGPIGDGVIVFDRYFYGDLRHLVLLLQDQRAEPQLGIDNLPEVLACREVGQHNMMQVRVFPKENVWEREAQGRFTAECESVDPQVVGMPIMTYYDSQVLREANEQAGVYALVAIWILLFIYFRNVKLALLALMPKVVGVLWMVGIMGWCGVNFNSANFLALPMILGIGLVFGIHVVHRVLEESDEGIFAHSTGPAIALAALTTMFGFGTLMLASYQGIASLGFVMTVGVGANLVSSAVLLPVVLKLMRGVS